MKLLKQIFLFFWLFPIPIIAFLNLKKETFVKFQEDLKERSEFKGLKFGFYKIWIRPFYTCWWPFILIDDSELSHNDIKHVSKKAMEHEYRHFKQMKYVSGMIFLLSYIIFWIILLPIVSLKKENDLFVAQKSIWYRAYYYIPWEIDARKYAEKINKI